MRKEIPASEPRKLSIMIAVSALALALSAWHGLSSARAAESPAPASAPAAVPAPNDSAVEKVNVESIKERYWARGDESELGVVQNRAYSKVGKFEVGFHGGMLSTDPFLTVRNTGGSVGFHFSEYWSMRLLAWKSYSSDSTALSTFRELTGGETNYNKPLSFYGTEGSFAFIYGKLSLVGKAIIYYDMHLAAGAGATQTQSGTYFTPIFGIGQKVFLSSLISLRVDYRAMTYREAILERVVPTKIGTIRGERTNWTHAVTFGVDFLFGGFSGGAE